MEKFEDMIYPGAARPPSGIPLRAIATTLFALFVVGGLIYLVARKGKEAPPPQPPPIQGDVSIQAGFFTVSQSPSRITIEQGDTKSIEVKIKVLPFEGFTDTVTFAVDDILKDGKSIKGEDLVKAAFSPAKLESKNFEKGTMLTVTPTTETTQGNYVLNYRVQSESVKKNFRIMMVVQ